MRAPLSMFRNEEDPKKLAEIMDTWERLTEPEFRMIVRNLIERVIELQARVDSAFGPMVKK